MGFEILDDVREGGRMHFEIEEDTMLGADIRVIGDHVDSTVTFKLGWWDINYPTMPIVPIEGGLPVFPAAGFQWTDPVQHHFDLPGTWYTVNPFEQILLPEQPRWLVVFVQFDQAPGESIWVDNLVLTSKCSPEPASVVALMSGLVGLAGFLKRRRA